MSAAQCGTDSGYNRHRRDGEATCPPCKKAHADAHRTTTRARNRAYVKLSRMFAADFHDIYARELFAEKQGGVLR